MGDIVETVKAAFDKRTGLVLVGGIIGAISVLAISNALQSAPNLLYPGQGGTA